MVVSLCIPMAHLGFIIVPNGYTHEKIVQGRRDLYPTEGGVMIIGVDGYHKAWGKKK